MSESEARLVHASEPAESHTAPSQSKVDTACESLLGTVKSTFDPFKETFSSDGNALHHVSEAVNSLASLQGMPSQLLNTGIAQIPLLDMMPGMPAATIGVPHLGTPHAHSHPPSSGFPLPSIGATIGSGCLSVLIGGIPAARVLDIGIAPTCGGLTPYFDIQTGSSNTFIGGMRAARMGIDMTRHCNPMGHVGKAGVEEAGAAGKAEEAASEAAEVTNRAKQLRRAGKAWKAGNMTLGPASGGMTAADDAWQGEVEAAVMTAAQTAADLAMMMLSNLMGKDPGIEPSMGTLLAGNPTVLIGGFPLPDSQMMWHGAKHGVGKKVRPKLPKLAQELACEFWGEPVSAVTGEVKNDFTDYETDDGQPFRWCRYYCSGWHERDGALGYGFRHSWQHELRLLRTRAIYTNPRGTEYTFSRRTDGTYDDRCQGYVLEQQDSGRFIVRHEIDGNAHFERTSETSRLARYVWHVLDGVRSDLHWNACGTLTKITQADSAGHFGRVVEFRYDQRSRIAEVVLNEVDGRINCIARYRYDSKSCLTSYSNALDAVWACEYDSRRRIVRLVDANGYAFSYRYDTEGRCVESSGQDRLWHVQLQYQPGRTIVTEGEGGKWIVVFNDVGTIIRVIDPYGGTHDYVTGQDGRITDEIDSGGRVLQWLYNGQARNIGRVDRWGNLWPIKDEAPTLPNPLALKVPDTPLSLQWGEANVWDMVDGIMLPPAIQSVAATIFGSTTSVDWGPVVRRDVAGQVIAHTGESGSTECFQLDPAGNMIRLIDGDGHQYLYKITSWNLRASETDPLGSTVAYRYTSKRKLAAITDANGNESAYGYDFKNRLVSVTRHGALRETYRYDDGNRLIEKRDGKGNSLLRFEVGDNGLHSKRVLASGETHVYEYDARGNATKASTDRFDIRLAYDGYGRHIADKRDGRGVDHVFDSGRLASTAYFDRFVIRYTSTSDGEERLDTPVGSHRIRRGSDGRILMQLGNGTNVLGMFDVDGRCVGRIVWSDDRASEARVTRYQYSATGELRRVIDSASGSSEYQYDAAHRLTGETLQGWPVRFFQYDAGGNLLATPTCSWMRYSEGNRLSKASTGTFIYNDRNHLAEELTADNVRTCWHYNSMDLLVKVAWSNRDDAWTAEYDGLCRRIFKALGDSHTEYYWDGDRLAAEVQPDGRLRLYVYVNERALLPFMFIDYTGVDARPESGCAHFVFHNQVGLPEWICDAAGKEVWRAEDIDPYGTIRVTAGNKVDYALRWPGHYFDQETGLHYNRFRSYRPAIGRYLQSDPLGQSGGVNLYAYSRNPIVSVDVLGLKCTDPDHPTDCDGKGAVHENNQQTYRGQIIPVPVDRNAFRMTFLEENIAAKAEDEYLASNPELQKDVNEAFGRIANSSNDFQGLSIAGSMFATRKMMGETAKNKESTQDNHDGVLATTSNGKLRGTFRPGLESETRAISFIARAKFLYVITGGHMIISFGSRKAAYESARKNEPTEMARLVEEGDPAAVTLGHVLETARKRGQWAIERVTNWLSQNQRLEPGHIYAIGGRYSPMAIAKSGVVADFGDHRPSNVLPTKKNEMRSANSAALVHRLQATHNIMERLAEETARPDFKPSSPSEHAAKRLGEAYREWLNASNIKKEDPGKFGLASRNLKDAFVDFLKES